MGKYIGPCDFHYRSFTLESEGIFLESFLQSALGRDCHLENGPTKKPDSDHQGTRRRLGAQAIHISKTQKIEATKKADKRRKRDAYRELLRWAKIPTSF